MSLSSNSVEESAGAVVAGALDRSTELLVVNPPRALMATLIDRLAGTEDPPRVRLFADPEPLKTLLERFVSAAKLADLVAEGVVTVRTLRSVPRTALLLSTDSVVALIPGPDRSAGLTATDGDVIGRTYDRFDQRWATAPEYEVGVPPLSTVRETLRSELGKAVATDFETLLAAGPGSDPDAVTLCLLAAARNDQLLYDISRWGEAVGLASKATFSRTKTALEDAGLLGTESVPIEVGRPRLRLTLPPDLAGEPANTLVREARDRR